MPINLFIFAVLLLVNALMAVAMLLASRTLGQPKMALLLACAFGGNVLLYLTDAIYIYLFHGHVWISILVSATAMIPSIFAASAYRMRSGLPLRLKLLIGALIIGLLLIWWLSTGYPNRGLREAVVPFYAAAVLLFAMSGLLRRGHKLRLGERPILITTCAMAAVEAAGGMVLAAMGNDKSPALQQAYMLIIFLGLPAMTVGAGIFSLYLLGGDLAERLRIAADTDSLTGAPNRRAIEATGNRLMAEARASGQPLAIAICDVDHFKDINDIHGHGRGDEVLCRLTALFRDMLPDPDHFGRFGGEEFILLFPNSDTDTAHKHVEALRSRIMAMSIDDHPEEFTASFGVARMVPRDHLLADIIKRADWALYASKQAGRNRTTVHELL